MTKKRAGTATRRDFLRGVVVTPAALLLAACGRLLGQDTAEPTPAAIAVATPGSAAQSLPPTPACADDDDVTPPQTAGPFYTPDTPQRTSLREAGIDGAPLLLSGVVLGTDCRPVPGALLDFWHADANGVYDNEGYKLRGHQFADENGRYALETILPGLYPGRTRHIHVIVQAPNRPPLTTQLYFPDEPGNARDGLFDPALLVTRDGEETAVFDFVLAL